MGVGVLYPRDVKFANTSVGKDRSSNEIMGTLCSNLEDFP